jgi:protein PhnA
MCPESAHEWSPLQQEESGNPKILDSNGKELHDGDSVIVIKDLPVKRAPKPIKAGTKVKEYSPQLFQRSLYRLYN